VKKMISYFKKNEGGQGVMEYIIITSLIGIICLGVIKGFGDVLQERINYMKKKIVKVITIK